MNETRKIPRPCLDCGALTTIGNRCQDHQRAADQRKQQREAGSIERQARKRALYGTNNYRKRAKAVRESAVICWLCGGLERAGDPWQADHVRAGDPTSELLPAHRSCNARRGNR